MFEDPIDHLLHHKSGMWNVCLRGAAGAIQFIFYIFL